MQNHPTQNQQLTSPGLRNGVSLVEVLVSVMIMGIGVGLLATLFPISVARTAQASQLTQSVFLRNNAEAYIEFYPTILSNSVIPLANTTFPYNNLAVLDPMGAASGLPVTLNNIAGGIPRVPTGINLATAQQISMLPDSWSDVFEVAISGYSATGITITNAPSNFTPWSSSNLSNAHYRIILFDITNKFAVLRDLLQVSTVGSATTYSWQDGTINEPALPTGFTPVRARIEVQVQRFTWLMTVTKYNLPTVLPTTMTTPLPSSTAWAAELNVAVFFNRSFKLSEEQAYPLTLVVGGLDGQPGVANVDDDNINGVDDAGELGWLGSDDNRTISLTIPAGAAAPYLKKGSYMLDAGLLKWYRIANISKTNGNILLDRDFRISPNQAGMFMKGIIEVYPLGIRTGQY